MKYIKGYKIFESDESDKSMEDLVGSFLRTYGGIPLTKKESNIVIKKILYPNVKNIEISDIVKYKIGDSVDLKKDFDGIMSNTIRFGAYYDSLMGNKSTRGHNFEGLISGLFNGELAKIETDKNDLKILGHNISSDLLGENEVDSECGFSVKFRRSIGESITIGSFHTIIKKKSPELLHIIEEYTQRGVYSIMNNEYTPEYYEYYDTKGEDNKLRLKLKNIWKFNKSENKKNKMTDMVTYPEISNITVGDFINKLPDISEVNAVIREALAHIISSELKYIAIGYPLDDRKIGLSICGEIYELLLHMDKDTNESNIVKPQTKGSKYSIRLKSLKNDNISEHFKESTITFPKLDIEKLDKHRLTKDELDLSTILFGEDNKRRIRPTVLRSLTDKLKDNPQNIITKIEKWMKNPNDPTILNN